MRFLTFALVLMIVSCCLAADKKTLLTKMNMVAQKPLFDDEKVDVGYGGSRHGKTGRSGLNRVGSGRVKRVTLSRLKRGLGQSDCGLGWPVFFTWIFCYKENNMYLSFEKLCNKLLDVKCIILNSPLILRMNSVKLISTYSIILKLYKS